MRFPTRRLSRHAAAALAIACLGLPTAARAHGGLSMDEDSCKLRVGRFVMHFVGYQPESSSGPREFCEDIPETGRTVVVLDYVNNELRDLPTEVRVIRDTGDESKLDEITVLHMPPKVYRTGSLSFEHDFTQAGRFIGLVTVGTDQKLVSRFPFSVGRTGSWWHMVVPIVVAAVGGFGLYRYAVRRRSGAPQPRDA